MGALLDLDDGGKRPDQACADRVHDDRRGQENHAEERDLHPVTDIVVLQHPAGSAQGDKHHHGQPFGGRALMQPADAKEHTGQQNYKTDVNDV